MNFIHVIQHVIGWLTMEEQHVALLRHAGFIGQPNTVADRTILGSALREPTSRISAGTPTDGRASSCTLR